MSRANNHANNRPIPLPRTLRSAGELIEAGLVGLVGADDAQAMDRAAEAMPIAITPHLLDHMTPAIARQFVPTAAELQPHPDDTPDPIGDEAHSPVRGIVHRYPDRVLVKPLLHCPAYCRFCFRRGQIGEDDGSLSDAELDAAVAYIAERKAVREAILTGGDPLMLPPARLGEIVHRLAAVPHIEVVRIHTRVPVTDPRRVGPDTVTALRAEKAVFVVVHCNHPDELTPETLATCARLIEAGIPMLSQTVLLKGVNDDVEVLAALMRALVARRITPYYLHHPDLAPGTAHFRPTLAEGRALVAELRKQVSGICMPTYVLDIPGGFGKVPAEGPLIEADSDGRYRVRDRLGETHAYPPAKPPRGAVADTEAT
ncbi:MAG: lysine-2,3-aminomutase-like protein [Rhodospirillales bacterium]|nr:lysine-2,3-aminomutase-like protein [Rhodospirillales bacterium]